jgi:hypothetical protein
MNDALDWLRAHLGEWALVKVYIACAIAGGTILLGQAGLNLFGMGGDVDIDADVDADALDAGDGTVSFLSVRTLASFMTMFGLVGWLGTAQGWGELRTPLFAFLAGSSIMLLVAYMMFMFQRLASEGNLSPRTAIGKTARVYLKIPAARSGKGKVTVVLQGRSEQFSAVTAGEELPTGSDCRLVDMTTEDTFQVEPL